MYLVRTTVCLSCLFVLCGLAGCGGGTAGRSAVSGTVKFDGKPVAQGVIAFIPAAGVVGPSTGAEIKNGKYDIPTETGPALGAHRVEITATRSEGTRDIKGVAGSTAGPSGAAKAAVVEMYIPEQYNKKSTLEFVVKKGSNTQNFDLKAK